MFVLGLGSYAQSSLRKKFVGEKRRMMKFVKEKMHVKNGKGSYATVLQNRGLYRRTLVSIYTESFILGRLNGTCVYVCMNVPSFPLKAQ